MMQHGKSRELAVVLAGEAARPILEPHRKTTLKLGV